MIVEETFSERLARLVEEGGLSDTEIGSLLGVSEVQAKRVREGTTQSLKLVPALRLCRKLGVSPWELAGEPVPANYDADAQDFDDLLKVVRRLEAAQTAIVAALRSRGVNIELPQEPPQRDRGPHRKRRA
jgi:transcriptional regulator with XRE-family HTH domain